MPQNNEDNRETLANAIVEGWDLSDLIYYATQALAKDMEDWYNDEFKAEWKNVFDDSGPAPATTKD